MSNVEFEPDSQLSLDPEQLKRYKEIKEKRPWRLYTPIPAIKPFHLSTAPIRVLAGPNRGGKTTAGAFETVCYATGYNPIRNQRYDTPNVVWAIALDHVNMGAIQRRTLFSMLPRGFKYYKMDSRIVLPKPWESEIVLKSSDSGREKFQGEGLTAAWFDEEPIGDAGHEIFKEVYARRKPGVPLSIFMTFTPLQGLSWSYHYLWDKRSPKRIKGVDTFAFDLFDCSVDKGGYMSNLEIDTLCQGYSEWERRARVHGHYTIMGGSPYFSPDLIISTREKCEPVENYTLTLLTLGIPNISHLKMEKDPNGDFTVCRPGLKGHSYIIGVDAGGGVGRDATVASVWDRDDLVECAQWHSNKVDPHDFGSRILPAIGMLYNNAQIVVETTGEHGTTVNNALRSKRYSNMYSRQNWDSIKRRAIPEWGFRTNPRTRPLILDTLTKMLREQQWGPLPQTLDEMSYFVINNDNKAEAMAGLNDDRVMAAGIALFVNMENPMPKIDYESLRVTYKRGDGDWMGY